MWLLSNMHNIFMMIREVPLVLQMAKLALKIVKVPEVFLSFFNFLSLSRKCCQNYTFGILERAVT